MPEIILNDPELMDKLALAEQPIQPKTRTESRSGRYWRTVQWRHAPADPLPIPRQLPEKNNGRNKA